MQPTSYDFSGKCKGQAMGGPWFFEVSPFLSAGRQLDAREEHKGAAHHRTVVVPSLQRFPVPKSFMVFRR